MKLVIIESPYAGDVATHETYARRCLADSLRRGEAPIASHLLYTQPGVLDDTIPEERQQGIDAGLAWGALAEVTTVYTDYGMSRGMEYGIKHATDLGRPIEFRSIGKNPRPLGITGLESPIDVSVAVNEDGSLAFLDQPKGEQ